jgi:hypothetical protein
MRAGVLHMQQKRSTPEGLGGRASFGMLSCGSRGFRCPRANYRTASHSPHPGAEKAGVSYRLTCQAGLANWQRAICAAAIASAAMRLFVERREGNPKNRSSPDSAEHKILTSCTAQKQHASVVRNIAYCICGMLKFFTAVHRRPTMRAPAVRPMRLVARCATAGNASARAPRRQCRRRSTLALASARTWPATASDSGTACHKVPRPITVKGLPNDRLVGLHIKGCRKSH